MKQPLRWLGVAASLAVLAASVGAVADPAPPPHGADGSIMRTLLRIERQLQHSEYSHVTRVIEKEGHYVFDCSGMVAWVLRRTAPGAYSAVLYGTGRTRSLAADYHRRIAATPPGKPRWGWQRVERVSDARPGDVIAWIKPSLLRSPNTGHVAFVVAPPTPVADMRGAYLLRIADASRYQHQDDSREGTGRTGFGHGTILVLADLSSGEPRAYGWVGERSRWLLPTEMAIGRPVR